MLASLIAAAALASAPPSGDPNHRVYRWPDGVKPSAAASARPNRAPRALPTAAPTPRPTPRPTPTPAWPQAITLYVGEGRMSTGPALGLEPVQLPIVNRYTGLDGCWLAVLSRQPRGGVYQAGDAWVHGLVRVQGGYDDDGFAKPKGYKGTAKKLAAEPAWQQVVREAFPAADEAWPGGETFLFTPLLEP